MVLESTPCRWAIICRGQRDIVATLGSLAEMTATIVHGMDILANGDVVPRSASRASPRRRGNTSTPAAPRSNCAETRSSGGNGSSGDLRIPRKSKPHGKITQPAPNPQEGSVAATGSSQVAPQAAARTEEHHEQQGSAGSALPHADTTSLNGKSTAASAVIAPSNGMEASKSTNGQRAKSAVTGVVTTSSAATTSIAAKAATKASTAATKAGTPATKVSTKASTAATTGKTGKDRPPACVIDLLDDDEGSNGGRVDRGTPPRPAIKVERWMNGTSKPIRKAAPADGCKEDVEPPRKRQRVQSPRSNGVAPREVPVAQQCDRGPSRLWAPRSLLHQSRTAPSAVSANDGATATAVGRSSPDQSTVERRRVVPHPSRASVSSGPLTLLRGPSRRVWGPLPRPAIAPSQRRPRVLLTTGVDASQKEIVESAAMRLDRHSRVAHRFDADVTHVVTTLMPAEAGVPGAAISSWRCKRTLKYMLGLAYGCWVVSVGWARRVCERDRERAGSVAEVGYEVKQDNCAVGGANLARRRCLEGQPPLFAGWHFVLARPGKPHYQMSSGELRLLFRLLGATVVEGLDAWAALVAYGEGRVIDEENDESEVEKTFWRTSRGGPSRTSVAQQTELGASVLPVSDRQWLISEGLRADAVVLVDGNYTSEDAALRWQRDTGCATVDMLWVLQCVSSFEVTSFVGHRVPEPSDRPAEAVL